MSTTDDADAERWRVATSVSTNLTRWHTDRDCVRIADAEPIPASDRSIEFHDLIPCGECADGPKPSDEQDWSDDECPVCGEPTGNLGSHLRTNCEGTQ